MKKEKKKNKKATASRESTKSKKEEGVKKQKTYQLNLTKLELLHLRDVMGILLPPAADTTISQELAKLESRTLVESVLWKKLGVACEAAKLPLGDAAPDYVVAPASAPPISVFQLAAEPQVEEGDEESDGASFLDNLSEDD